MRAAFPKIECASRRQTFFIIHPSLFSLVFLFFRCVRIPSAAPFFFGLHVWVNFSIARQHTTRARQNEEEALRVWKLNATGRAERKARAERRKKNLRGRINITGILKFGIYVSI